MNVIEVDPGVEPPVGKPRITVISRKDGKFEFYGVSASLDLQLDARIFESQNSARAAAISWAVAHNYGDIYLVTQDA